MGFPNFANDHEDMLPPAGWANGSATGPKYQISWDSLVNRYIGGNATDDQLNTGIFWTGDKQADPAPAVLACPADTFPKVNWVGGTEPWFSLKSYAMVACGQAWPLGYQRDPKSGLPNLYQPGGMGVGIYWQASGSGAADFDAKGYPSSVVKDPSGTFLLVEETHGQQIAGNIWTCVCLGPEGKNVSGANSDLWQTVNPALPLQDPNSKDSVCEGNYLYKAHNKRFNYAFFDAHVETLRLEETIGGGTLAVPKGGWTVMPGD
jgi:prepilin-type processing-associated H-X9-DG protein